MGGSGICSLLGGAFGIAFSGTIYGMAVMLSDVFQGAMIALWINVGMGIIALIAIIFTVPNNHSQRNT